MATTLTEEQPKIAGLIPAYQEGLHIAEVVHGVRQHGLPVVVVDDGSTDDTVSEAERAGATVLRQPGNLGKGAALKEGIRWTLATGYDALITLDGDGQHDPSEIPLFLEAYASHDHDLVIGVRNFDEMPWTRQTMNVLGRWTLSWAMGMPMPDNQSGYRLLSRRLAQAVLESDESGYEFEVDMIAICLRNSYDLGWVPISTIYAGQRSHIDHIPHVYRFLRLAWRIRQERRALG